MSRCVEFDTNAAYRLACCSYVLAQLAVHDSGVFSPDVGRVKIPVLGIYEGKAVSSVWVAERVTLLKSALSKRRLSTLLVQRWTSQLEIGIHDFT